MSAKLLELIWSFEIGGSERLAGQLAASFAASGRSVMVCATHRGHDVLSERLQEKGIECIALNAESRGRLGRVLLPFQLWWLIVSRRIKVVHVHHFFLLPVCFHAVKLAGARLVATEHTDFDMRRSQDERDTVGRYCRKSPNLSVIHAGIRDFMIAQLGVAPEQIKVILNGVDTEEFHPPVSVDEKRALRQRFGLPADKIVFGWVGRMHRDKDLPNLVEAFNQVATDDVHLLLIGDGRERASVEALLAERGINNVSLPGMRSDIPELLRSLDVFVLSSATEGMPLVILEALSTGLPVVSTDVGGIAEALSDGCALLVPPGDAPALGAAMQQLASGDKQRRAMSNAAREWATRNYDFSKTREQYEELLFGNR